MKNLIIKHRYPILFVIIIFSLIFGVPELISSKKVLVKISGTFILMIGAGFLYLLAHLGKKSQKTAN